MIRNASFAFIFLCLVVAGCSSDSEDLVDTPPGGQNPPPTSCDTTNVTFAGTITPLLTTYGCASCHSGGAPAGNVNLSSYNGVKAAVNSGRLFGAINHQPGFKPMPQGGGKMPACDINKFKAWIDRGALNN